MHLIAVPAWAACDPRRYELHRNTIFNSAFVPTTISCASSCKRAQSLSQSCRLAHNPRSYLLRREVLQVVSRRGPSELVPPSSSHRKCRIERNDLSTDDFPFLSCAFSSSVTIDASAEAAALAACTLAFPGNWRSVLTSCMFDPRRLRASLCTFCIGLHQNPLGSRRDRRLICRGLRCRHHCCSSAMPGLMATVSDISSPAFGASRTNQDFLRHFDVLLTTLRHSRLVASN